LELKKHQNTFRPGTAFGSLRVAPLDPPEPLGLIGWKENNLPLPTLNISLYYRYGSFFSGCRNFFLVTPLSVTMVVILYL